MPVEVDVMVQVITINDVNLNDETVDINIALVCQRCGQIMALLGMLKISEELNMLKLVLTLSGYPTLIS